MVIKWSQEIKYNSTKAQIETDTKGNQTYGYSNICMPDIGRLAFATLPLKLDEVL
jgi:hypothetical protein